jgi:hypothetical protein
MRGDHYLMLLRALAASVLILALVNVRGPAPAGADDTRPRLYVYLHTEAKSAALERALQDKLPGLAVTAFSRFRDFEEALGTRPPDAVLALAPLLASQNLTPVLQGVRGGQEREPYVLLAPMNLDGSIAGKVIGVVDLLGRDRTQDLVGKLVGTPDVKIKRVTKIEDLLPLLQFAVADAVLVPAEAVKEVTERSRLPLSVRTLPDAYVGLPAIGSLNSKVPPLMMKLLLALDGNTLRSLGIEQWKRR